MRELSKASFSYTLYKHDNQSRRIFYTLVGTVHFSPSHSWTGQLNGKEDFRSTYTGEGGGNGKDDFRSTYTGERGGGKVPEVPRSDMAQTAIFHNMT